MNVLFLNSKEAMTEAFVRQGEIFLGRPTGVHNVLLHEDSSLPHDLEFWMGGIGLNVPPSWKDQRRFFLRAIKSFSFGQKNYENVLIEEFDYFTKLIRDTHNRGETVFDPSEMLLTIICNNRFKMFFGRRMDKKDKENVYKAIQVGKDMAALTAISMFPICRYIPSIRAIIERNIKLRPQIHEFINKEIEEHKVSFIADNPPQDYVEAYLQAAEIEKNELENKEVVREYGNDTIYTDMHLIHVITDILTAGTGTSAAGLDWAFYLLASNPDVQRKAQEEIDCFTGRGHEKVAIQDKSRLHYTNAVYQEILRRAVLSPYGAPRVALNDTELFGYYIPRGTIALANLYGMQMDETKWVNPLEFKPERFLDENGCFNIKSRETFYPFGTGKRACPGEGIARMETFFIVANLLKFFHLSFESEEDVRKYQDNTSTSSSNLSQPVPQFKACFTWRNNNNIVGL